MLNELERYMEEVEVKSSHNGYIYRLSDILIIMICGLLANLREIDRIHFWSESKLARDFLKKEFGITEIPCRSHFYSMLACVNYEVFAQCFSDWMASMLQGKIADKVIAIDGNLYDSESFSHFLQYLRECDMK